MKTKFTHPALTDEQTDDQIVLIVDTTRIVCPQCGGGGTHGRKDIDDSRLFDLMHVEGDEEGMEDYHKGGHDVICDRCHGRNVVDEIDWEKFEAIHPESYRKILSWNKEAREDREYSAQERRAGA